MSSLLARQVSQELLLYLRCSERSSHGNDRLRKDDTMYVSRGTSNSAIH